MWQLAFFQIEGDSLFTHFQLVGCTECKAGLRVSGLMGGKTGSGERLTPTPPRAQMGTSVTASCIKCHAGSSGPDAQHLSCFPDGWEQEDTVYRVYLWKKSSMVWPSDTVMEGKKCLFHGDLDSYRNRLGVWSSIKPWGRPTAYVNATALHASSCYVCASV